MKRDEDGARKLARCCDAAADDLSSFKRALSTTRGAAPRHGEAPGCRRLGYPRGRSGAALPAGFASGADLGREGDVAALRDALAELSRARATCASSLARGLDAPDLRARARERASWTTLVASNAPAPPTSTARGDASGAAPPPTTRISRRMARSGATTLRRAPFRCPRARERAREPATHPDVHAASPPRRPTPTTPRATTSSPPPRTRISVGPTTRRRAERRGPPPSGPNDGDPRPRTRALGGSPRDSIDERASTRGATLILPRATSPSLDASLDAPESAYRRLAASLGNFAARIPSTIRRVRRRETRRRGTDTSDDDGSGRGPRRERAPTPAATLPRSALTVPRSALTTAPPKTTRVSSSGRKSKPSARDETLPDSVATRVEETPAADTRTRGGGGGRRIRFSVGATGQTHALDDAVDDVATARDEAREGVLTSRNLAEDSPASSTTCVLRVKFEASSVRGVTVSRDVSGGGANVAVVARRDVSDGEVAEVLAWRVGPPLRATLLGSVRFRLVRRRRRGDTNRRDRRVADVRRGVISARAPVRLRRVRPSRSTPTLVATSLSTASGWRFPPRIFQTRRPSTACACVAWRRFEHPRPRAPAGRHRVGDERRGCRGCRGCRGTGRDGGVGFAHPKPANVVADGRRVFRQVALASSIERDSIRTRPEDEPSRSRVRSR